MTPKKKTGRKRIFEPDGPQATIFLERVTDGQRLKQALVDSGLVWGVVSRWIANDAPFASRYARAREASAAHFEDKATGAVEEATPETAHVAKIRDDHYRWRAKVANPKRYGDKVDVTSGGNPVAGVVMLPLPEELKDGE